MGASDIVPGVSGATIAIVMGFYEDLIHGLRSITSTRCKEVPWKFFLALFLGVSISFLSLSRLFNHMLHHEVYRTLLYAWFFGLIVGSVIFCAKQVENWHIHTFGALVVGVIVAFLLTGTQFNSQNSEPLFDVKIPKEQISILDIPIKNYDKEKEMVLGVSQDVLSAMLALEIISSETQVLSRGSKQMGAAHQFVVAETTSYIDWWLVFCGMLAVCAMLLPGISGSYVLVILGLYPTIIEALADFVGGIQNFHLPYDAIFTLSNMLLGIVLGGLFFSRIVSWLLKHYRQIMLTIITGFMIGALFAVWPFWSYEYVLNPLKLGRGPQLEVVEPMIPSMTSPLMWQAAVIMLLGFGLVVWIAQCNKQNVR